MQSLFDMPCAKPCCSGQGSEILSRGDSGEERQELSCAPCRKWARSQVRMAVGAGLGMEFILHFQAPLLQSHFPRRAGPEREEDAPSAPLCHPWAGNSAAPEFWTILQAQAGIVGVCTGPGLDRGPLWVPSSQEIL